MVTQFSSKQTIIAHPLSRTDLYISGPYFERTQTPHFFPRIDITFKVDQQRRLHVPVLISPYGYSTYRGS